MFIYYTNEKFHIEVPFTEDRDLFDKQINFLKSHYIFFNVDSKSWVVDNKKIEEILLWLDKELFEYTIQDSAKEKLQEIKNSYKNELQLFESYKFDTSILNETINPYRFQIADIEWILQRSAHLDALDAGLGKTFIAICAFAQLYKMNMIDGIVIIVPLGLSFHWLRQIIEFTNVFNEQDIQIINNAEKIQPFQKYQDKKVLIIRQDLIADVVASYNKTYDKIRSLKKLKWGIADYVDVHKEWNKKNLLICVDEAHSIKHSSAIKTKALFSIKKYFKYRYLLTATPAINGIKDLYSLLRFIDTAILPFEENAFRIWISDIIGNKWDKYAIIKYNTQNVRKVMQSYKHVFIQRRKEDLEEVKTKKFISTINCELTSLQNQLYRKIVERELNILQEEFDTITWKQILNKIHLLLEVFDNPLLLKKRQYDDVSLNKLIDKWKIEDDPKFIFLKDYVEYICGEQNKKIIIYDIHPDTLNKLCEKFIDYKPLIIHGSLDIKNKDLDRQEKQDLFNFDKKHRMFLLSLYTSSAGLNLQHGASNIVINTLAMDATLFRQAQDRIYRIDSKFNSIIKLPYYPNSLDNIRMQRNFNRIELNSKMDQELTQKELDNLLRGIV